MVNRKVLFLGYNLNVSIGRKNKINALPFSSSNIVVDTYRETHQERIQTGFSKKKKSTHFMDPHFTRYNVIDQMIDLPKRQ